MEKLFTHYLKFFSAMPIRYLKDEEYNGQERRHREENDCKFKDF